MVPKISIVVPVYRAEKYLAQCVDSLLAQALQEIEIILVDDGSPDNSGKIADEYAKKELRIKVIHQDNKGSGPARNAGMDIALGEYVGFVDSDDWVEPGMYAELYADAVRNGADIVVSGHCDVADGKVVKQKRHPLAGKTVTGAEEILEIRKNLFGHGVEDKTAEAFPMSVCMSIYRKEMLQKYKIRFRKILSEDTLFNLQAYKYASVISFSGETAYNYRKEGQESITKTFSSRNKDRFEEYLCFLAQLAKEENDEECILRAKKMAIDYCRLYIEMLGNSGESFRNKRRYVKEYVQTEAIAKCWEGYPQHTLLPQQRIFHWVIEKRLYSIALVLNDIRRSAWKG